MDAKTLFSDVFSKTKDLLAGLVDEENEQASYILYYLSLFACYLKGEEEAIIFREFWLEIREKLKSISDQSDFLNQVCMMEDHIKQSLKNENIHALDNPENMGIYRFYEEKFPSLYEQAKTAQERQYQAINNWARNRQAYVKKLTEDDQFFDREVKNNPMVWMMLD